MTEDGGELIAGAREVVVKTVETSNMEERADWSVIKEKIRIDLKRYINKKTSKRPLILPVILEI
jgi:ribonuclease J